MSQVTSGNPTPDDERLADLADDFARRYRRGEHPSAEEYAQKHPDLAAPIRELFPALLAMEQSSAESKPDVAPRDERVGAVIGRYKLLESLGEGGFGAVFMAEQQHPVRRIVALKVIKPGLDTRQVINRFEAERQALALMDHPNIARVLDAGTTGSGRPFFVMELVKGVPITRYADEHRLTPQQRLELFIPVCQAVQHAHQKGIIHRDLKPSNVLVAAYDGRPVPKVIDFGVAKAAQVPLTDRTVFTEFGAMVGTLEYMSPEQAELNQLDVDTRSDVYSLGVLLYELLTGSTPLEGRRLKRAALLEALRVIREEEPPRPSTRLSTIAGLASIAANRGLEPKKLNGLVRGELDWIVMKCLEKDRVRRYETANGLALDVQRYLSDEPVQACPASRWYRFRKFARRNKRSVVAAAVVTLALIGGIVGTSWGLWRAEQALRREALRAEGERQANQVAQKRQGQVEKGYAILTSVFTDLDPAAVETEGKPLRAILGERLDRATQELQGEAVGDPLAVATLQAELARSQLALGYTDKAIDLYIRARATLTAKLGPDEVTTLAVTSNLAAAYRAAGKFGTALPLFEQTLPLLEAKCGRDHPDTLRCMGLLAQTYKGAGQPDRALSLFEEAMRRWRAGPRAEDRGAMSALDDLATAYHDVNQVAKALPLYEEALRLHKDKLGPEHPRTLIVMHNFARALRSAGQLERAVQLNEQTVAISTRTLGAEHPSTVLSMAQLAGSYRAVGKLDLAVPMMEDAFRMCRAKLGPEHPTTLTRMTSLAVAYTDVGRFEESLTLLTEALRIERAKLGPEHPDTITCLGILGATYVQAGKADQGIPLLEETLKLLGAAHGPEHLITLHNKKNLAIAYRDAGRLEQAIALHEPTLAAQERTLGPDHPETLYSMHALGTTYWAGGRLDQAIALLEKTLQRSTAKFGKDHSSTLRTLDELAVSYRDAGRVAEAIPLLQDAYERSRKLKLLPAELDRVGLDLAETYERAGDLSKAESLGRELVDRARQRFGADHLQTARSLAQLGSALVQLKRYADAEPVLRDCLTIRQKSEPDRWTTFMTQSLLGQALVGQSKFAEAESLLLDGYNGIIERESKIPVPARTLGVGQSLARLVELYRAWGKPAEASEWRNRSDAHERAITTAPADHGASTAPATSQP